MQPQILPTSLYSAAQVRELDRVAIEEHGIAGLTLMRRAADACVAAMHRHWPAARRITVFCGSGNNAGDGYLIAGGLAEKGHAVTVAVVGDPEKLGADATEAYRYCKSSGASVETWQPGTPAGGEVIVDALLGTGLTGAVRAHYMSAINEINAAQKSVLAVDIPSGLSADSGERLGAAVRASVTVTFIALKQGMFTLDGPDCCGAIEFSGLDIPKAVYASVPSRVSLLELDELVAQLPIRPRNAHKTMFGHVLVVGGDEGMGGAVAMSAEAALRTGAGLVSVATHPSHAGVVLARRPELMVRGIADPADLAPLLARASVIVLGPGLGVGDWSVAMFNQVMRLADRPSQAMVIDADGLNLLSRNPDRYAPEQHANRVLTPHPGEAGKLLQGGQVQADRFGAVVRLQNQYGGTVLLKGAGTLICDGSRTYLCPYGNPGMSTAGMGDVLSGVIAALLAQGLDTSLASRLGATVHAAAGDACAARNGERGLVAVDLMDDIRRLLNP